MNLGEPPAKRYGAEVAAGHVISPYQGAEVSDIRHAQKISMWNGQTRRRLEGCCAPRAGGLMDWSASIPRLHDLR